MFKSLSLLSWSNVVMSKKKIIGGREYIVLGSTISYSGRRIVQKKYTTTAGVVICENGFVLHPDGSKSFE